VLARDTIVRQHFLERYVQGTSLVHHLDPRLKLLATLGYVIVATSTPPRAWPAFAVLGALAAGAILLSQVPPGEALKRSSIVLPFAGVAALSLLSTPSGHVMWAWHPLGWPIAITEQGVRSFASVLLKAWLSVLVSGLLVATTPFPRLVMALRALGVPAVLTAILSFMYRYLFVLVDEAARLQTARQARSAGRGRTLLWRAQVVGGMIGSLFIRSYERSERIYAAMRSRGFDGELRTLTRLQWQVRDSWAALCWGVLLAGTAVVAHLPL
jgi:cobalt/nickel transport system permease protein